MRNIVVVEGDDDDGPEPGDQPAPNPVPDDERTAITGSSSGQQSGGGMCGLGAHMPLILAAFMMALRFVNRRR